MPALDGYLLKVEAAKPEDPEAKARRHLAAVRMLSQQFGIPLRQGGKVVQ